ANRQYDEAPQRGRPPADSYAIYRRKIHTGSNSQINRIYKRPGPYGREGLVGSNCAAFQPPAGHDFTTRGSPRQVRYFLQRRPPGLLFTTFNYTLFLPIQYLRNTGSPTSAQVLPSRRPPQAPHIRGQPNQASRLGPRAPPLDRRRLAEGPMDRRDMGHGQSPPQALCHPPPRRGIGPNVCYREASTQAGLDILGMFLRGSEGTRHLLGEGLG
ncbi:hypothetical protein CABS01_16428, partial [Colletotrichum abscissum]|uniref:uncharacterized protein n=1 Tax=Colletotrichum abscissum TaxID=1671311 RepID=UPI0027D5BEF6